MKRHLLLALAVAAASTIACQREADTKQIDTKTHTETTAAGEPIEKESESAARMPNDGKILTTEHNEYVGVVTRFDPDKGLTIKAADGESHSFDLNDREIATKVAPAVKNGSKVKVTVHKNDDGSQTISIAPQP